VRTAILFLTLIGTVRAGEELANPSFEQGLEGWTLAVGARLAATGPKSTIAVDTEGAREGRAAVRCTGSASTRIWPMLTQSVRCRPGDRVWLRVAARCRGVVREGPQFRNANALLAFRDAHDKRLALMTTPVLSGDRDWIDLYLHTFAPKNTTRVVVGLFASLTGRVWFDDVRLVVRRPDSSDPEDRAVARAALRLHLERTYPFFGVRGGLGPPDATTLREMLAPLGDLHVWIETPLGRTPTAPPVRFRRNFNRKAVRGLIDTVLLEKWGHLVGRMGDLGYVGIGGFSREGFADLERALDGLGAAKALIIDIRANGGGDERLAMRIAGRFTDRRRVYAKAQLRDPTLPGLNGFRPPFERSFGPLLGKKTDTRRVVVLQGPGTVSAAEGFLQMMKSIPRVVTMGLPSRGASGNPRPFPVYPALRVWAPVWRSLTPQGELLETRGVQPDLLHDLPESAFATADPTLEKARRSLE